MDGANERYVRIYTRDTVAWLALSWEARALMLMLLRKVDRAGLLALGRHGAKGLAVVVGMPPAVVASALAELVEEGTVELRDSLLVIPNFIEAQEAAQTDAHRARESRARRRDSARTMPAAESVTNRDDSITKRDANVTRRHTTSHDVTSCHSTPRHADLRLTNPPTPPGPPGGDDDPGEVPPPPVTETRAVRVVGPDGECGMLFSAWASGIAAATGVFQSEMSPAERRDVVALANAHAEGRRGQELLTWATKTATAFARSVDPTYGGFTTRRARTWLDSGRPPRAAPSAAAALVQPVPVTGRLWQVGGG